MFTTSPRVRISDLFMSIPMIFLTWVAGLLSLWAWEVTNQLLTQAFVFGGTIFTFLVALLKYLRDRGTEIKLTEAEKKLVFLSSENESLRVQVNQLEAERPAFRAEIRARVDAVEQQTTNLADEAEAAARKVKQVAEIAANKLKGY